MYWDQWKLFFCWSVGSALRLQWCQWNKMFFCVLQISEYNPRDGIGKLSILEKKWSMWIIGSKLVENNRGDIFCYCNFEINILSLCQTSTKNTKYCMSNETISRIKVVLVEQRKTNKWLAEKLGKTQATVSRWAGNKAQPSLDKLVEIARLLKVEARILLIRKVKLRKCLVISNRVSLCVIYHGAISFICALG